MKKVLFPVLALVLAVALALPIAVAPAAAAQTDEDRTPFQQSIMKTIAQREAQGLPVPSDVSFEYSFDSDTKITALLEGGITPGASATVSLAFTPADYGPQSGTLSIPSNDPDENPFYGVLTGNVFISVSPTSLDFGSVELGHPSSQIVTITNICDDTVYIGWDLMTGHSFAITGGGTAKTLAPADSVNITLTFTPQSLGLHADNLAIFNPSWEVMVVPLLGNGTAPVPPPHIVVAPSSIDFGDVPPGSSSAGRTVTVTNEGDGNLVIFELTTYSDPRWCGSFHINGSIPPLAPGASANITLVFFSYDDPDLGLVTGSLQIKSNDPDNGMKHVALSGSSVLLPDIAITPLTVDFGSVAIGQPSSPQTVIVTNEGAAGLTIDTISVVGANANQFSTQNDNCSGQTLAPSASQTLEVVFNPSSSGEKDAILSIRSNDPDENPFYVYLYGTVNAGPTVDAGPDATIDEGSTFTGSGSFTDPDSSSWTGIVDYGDGSGVQPLVLNPDRSFDLNHTYSENGIYTVVVIITDDNGAMDIATVTVTVNDLGPTSVLSGHTLLYEGQTGSYDASSSISNPDEIVSYEWDWDYDGVTFNPSSDNGATQSHTWNDNGTYTVAVRVTDDDGSTDIATLSVTVENLPPELMVEALSDDVDATDLPKATKISLKASLDTAKKVLDDSNTKNDVAAINALGAFINKIEAQSGKKVPEEVADELIAKAQEIIAALSGGT